MPATYTIDTARSMVFSHATGILTDADCEGHVEGLRKDPNFNPAMHQLVDFTQVTEIRVTASGVHKFAQRNPFGQNARRAFVVADEVVYGMARMYDSLTSHQPHDLIIFKELAKARAWLGLEP